nr:crosslink repair DNA glycosylase YcaQ family protein [uncultured Roseateles sp.]
MSRKPTEPSLEDLRRYAIARSLFKPTTLPAAIKRLGFVQADPIRAPARAQDLTLRLRVKDYRAGELEQRYARLGVEEDCFVNYGFVPREHLALLHPRVARRSWDAKTQAQAQAVQAFVHGRGATHPREVQAEFQLGQTRNAWGGSSNAITHLLDSMHYRGLLRVKRREQGQRIYETVQHEADESSSPQQKAEALVRLVLQKYAPLPARSLGQLCSMSRYGAPQLQAEVKRVQAQAKKLFAHTQVAGHTWFWPEDEDPRSRRWQLDEELRFLAPFDPIVWDRLRFELFWGWAYRFEAYTPAPKRKLGYYALPMLWRGEVLGWANANVVAGELQLQCGYLSGSAPSDPAFETALQRETERLRLFLSLDLA